MCVFVCVCDGLWEKFCAKIGANRSTRVPHVMGREYICILVGNKGQRDLSINREESEKVI